MSDAALDHTHWYRIIIANTAAANLVKNANEAIKGKTALIQHIERITKGRHLEVK